LPALQLQKKVSFQGSEEVIGALDDMLAAKAKAESPKGALRPSAPFLRGRPAPTRWPCVSQRRWI